MNRLIIVAAASALASTVAIAGEKLTEAADQVPQFKELDANADGQISVNEAKTNETISKVFEKIDADKSGALSADEYGKLLPQKKM